MDDDNEQRENENLLPPQGGNAHYGPPEPRRRRQQLQPKPQNNFGKILFYVAAILMAVIALIALIMSAIAISQSAAAINQCNQMPVKYTTYERIGNRMPKDLGNITDIQWYHHQLQLQLHAKRTN